MSEKMTRIDLPNQPALTGLMDHGEQSIAYMIELARGYADYLRSQAAVIDAAADADFQIDVVKGQYVQRHVRELQRSALLPANAATRQKDEAHA